jgi:hypothetical protein
MLCFSQKNIYDILKLYLKSYKLNLALKSIFIKKQYSYNELLFVGRPKFIIIDQN